jgi:hypothetical protein
MWHSQGSALRMVASNSGVPSRGVGPAALKDELRFF